MSEGRGGGFSSCASECEADALRRWTEGLSDAVVKGVPALDGGRLCMALLVPGSRRASSRTCSLDQTASTFTRQPKPLVQTRAAGGAARANLVRRVHEYVEKAKHARVKEGVTVADKRLTALLTPTAIDLLQDCPPGGLDRAHFGVTAAVFFGHLSPPWAPPQPASGTLRLLPPLLPPRAFAGLWPKLHAALASAATAAESTLTQALEGIELSSAERQAASKKLQAAGQAKLASLLQVGVHGCAVLGATCLH